MGTFFFVILQTICTIVAVTVMKIVYVYPTLASWGGVERILVDKMNLLARYDGYEVVALTYNQGNHPVPFVLDERVHHIDLQVRTHAKYQYKALRRLWEGWKRQRWLRARLKWKLGEIFPDVIVTTTNSELELLCQLKRNIPLVVESHGGYNHLIDYPTMTWAHRRDISRRYRLLRKADAIVSLTDNDARLWDPYYSQVKVIPNVVHLNPLNKFSDRSRKQIIFVGRLAEQKGIPELVAIWRIVYERHPDWQLHVYGEGDRERLQRAAPGIRAFPPTDSIFEKYCECSLLVLTSRWEPFGLVIPEAMSCGLPVVSFEGDGPCCIISDGKDGFLVKNRDVGVFADRICQLIDDEPLRHRMGLAAIQSAQRFAPENIMPRWKELFESLIQ